MQQWKFGLFIALIIFVLGIRSYSFYSQKPTHQNGEVLTIKTRIASEPEISAKNQRFTISLPYSEKVSITTGKYPAYSYGQAVSISGKLHAKEKNGHVLLSMYYPKILLREDKNIIMTSVISIRQYSASLFQSVLSPVHAALLLGIVFGIKQDIPDVFLEKLRSAGVMHVIAASGMNVSMVAAALVFVLQRWLSRRTALIISILGVCFYTLIAGMEPSIVRAAIMAAITFTAGILGKQKTPVYALFLTALVMLFINPSLLVDVGFQLSFAATLGIILLKPLFNRLEKGRIGIILGEDFTTTLAAQLATIPILLSAFGTVNVSSLFINLLILWTIPFLMVIGGVSVLIGFIIRPLAQVMIYVAYPLLWYFEKIVNLSQKVTLPISFDTVNITFIAGYYLTLIAVILFRNKQVQLKT